MGDGAPKKVSDQSSKRMRRKKKKAKEDDGMKTVEVGNVGTKDSSNRSRRRRKAGTRKKKKKNQSGNTPTTMIPPVPDGPTQTAAPILPSYQFTPVNYENPRDLGGFVQPLVDYGIRNLKKDFEVMNAIGKVETVHAPTSQANRQDNRYGNIHCLEATRIKTLKGNVYYNANDIDGKLIFAQSPKTDTVEKFWNLIESENVDTIIQLTAADGKKCVQYIGAAGQPFGAGNYKTLALKHDTAVDPDGSLAFNLIKYRGTGQQSKIVKHFFWKQWPDGGVPDVSNTLAFLHAQIKEDKRVLIHCASGSGRTAVVGLSLTLIDKSLNGGDCNLKSNVLELRKKRHLAIRNVLQYVYVSRLVIAFLMKYNACEMSQTLLEFIDDYDTFAKKFKKEQEEARQKVGAPMELLSELSNDFVDK